MATEKRAQNQKLEIENLETPQQKLTPEEAERVLGGRTRPTQEQKLTQAQVEAMMQEL
jgi:hypothetical protein